MRAFVTFAPGNIDHPVTGFAMQLPQIFENLVERQIVTNGILPNFHEFTTNKNQAGLPHLPCPILFMLMEPLKSQGQFPWSVNIFIGLP